MADEEDVEHFDDSSSYSESSDEEVAATLDIIKKSRKAEVRKDRSTFCLVGIFNR